VTPRRFAVVGDPVAHSRSPAMHTAAFRALGLSHVYEALRATASELPRVVDAVRGGSYDGLSVTVPHKERVLALVDELDASARVIGAANTLVRSSDARVTAHNTDAPALAEELRRLAGRDHSWTDARGLVLGSGGAARAAIAAFALLGVRQIVVRARAFEDPARRDRFVAAAPARVVPEPWRASPSGEGMTFAVVQATSAGMRGADPGGAVADAVDWDALPEVAVAIDVVYAPRDTPFLRAARKRGLRCDDGLGMLARQGALAFELWLGVPAPLEVMRAALEEA
jgi:shikimate dehydrogenase